MLPDTNQPDSAQPARVGVGDFWTAVRGIVRSIEAYARARTPRERAAALARLQTWRRRSGLALPAGEVYEKCRPGCALVLAAAAAAPVLALAVLAVRAPRIVVLPEEAAGPPVPAAHVAQLVAAGPISA